MPSNIAIQPLQTVRPQTAALDRKPLGSDTRVVETSATPMAVQTKRPSPAEQQTSRDKTLAHLCADVPWFKKVPLRMHIKKLSKKIKTTDAFDVFLQALRLESSKQINRARPFFRANNPGHSKQIGLIEVERQFKAACNAFKLLCREMQECGMDDSKQAQILRAMFPGCAVKPAEQITGQATPSGSDHLLDAVRQTSRLPAER